MSEPSETHPGEEAEAPMTDLVTGLATEPATDPVREPPIPMPRRGYATLVIGLLGVALIAAAALFAAERIIHQREGQLLGELERQMSLAVEGRGATLAGWLAGRRDALSRFSNDQALRLYTAESTAGERLANADITHLQGVLNRFAEEWGLDGLHLLHPDATPLLAGVGTPSLNDARREQALRTTGGVTLSPIGEPPFPLHLAAPVPPLQRLAESADNPPVGVVMATLPFAERHREAVALPLLGRRGERLRLLQPGEEALEVVGGGSSDLGPSMRELPFERSGERSGGRSADTFRLGRPVDGSDWLLLLEIDAAEALAPLEPLRLTVHLAAGLLPTLTALLLFAVWLRQRGEASRALADQYHALAEAMHTQNQLIEEINSAVGEHISLKGLDGRYQYVNHAFARAIGRTPEGMLGSLDGELFNSRDARRLEDLDELAREGEETIHAAATLRLGGGMRHFELSKTPFRDHQGTPAGIVTVARDVTDLIEQKRRSEMLIKQTTTAIGYLSEAGDMPHFSGQAKMTGKIATGIAKRLRLDADAVTTLEIAANLCHVGKLSLPPEIRFKEGRFTAEEYELMKNHMADADRLLGEIHFGLPVREAVVQMYERLDGSGYPSGLIGDDITPEARILGVANVFVAHTHARPYREALSVESAIEYLRSHPELFDADVVAALIELIQSSRQASRQ